MVPFSKDTITSVDELFGRGDIVDKLIAYAGRRENVALIGTRRFGKTCLFKSLCNYFLGLEDSPVFPLFLDFKEVAAFVNGTHDVYRYILARLIEELCRAGVYTKKEDYPSLNIVPSRKGWEDNFEELSDLKSVRLNSVMNDMIKEFSSLMEKTILFMIDEYEHLFVKSFTNPEGFMPLRSLSSVNEKDLVKPFAFWIAGAVGWKELCTQIGSAELNVINTSINLMPLEKSDFESMWKYEVSLCKEKDIQDMLLSRMDFAYQKTGGIPYYAKIVGSCLIVDGKEPDYTILTDYFDQIYNSLNKAERKLVKEIAVLPRNCKESKELRELIDKGLVQKNGTKFEIRIGFLTDYLKTIDNDISIVNNGKIECLTEDIFGLFSTINEQRKRRKKEVIFDTVGVDFSLYKGLKTLCQSEEDIKSFMGAVYLSFKEKSKSDGTAGNKLPPIIRYGTFCNAIDILRHVYGGHLEEKMEINAGQMTKSTALSFFIGSDHVPYHPDEFATLQIAVLTKFKDVLVSLLTIVRNEH